ncbi:MAG: class I SAM-dependent methyltransferase [Pyrinomonadaceae bacterium]
MDSNAINIKYQNGYEIAPCVREGGLSENARALVSASEELGDAPFASVLRAWCVPYLFHTMEELLASGEDPIAGVNSALKVLAEFLSNAQKSGFEVIRGDAGDSENPQTESGDVKDITGNHYGNLFKNFSSLSYWDEPVKLLRERLERNGISVADIESKKTLDAGCGGGRYSVAWRLLGAAPVVGLDISPINVEDANRRIREAGVSDMSFQKGDVLELPFEDGEFDVVFSNGVLHHTTDWEKGVKELVRVMKPGGLGWLYLIENPGGVFWDVIEILRLVMKDEEKSTARAALQSLKLPANRIFYMLDHVMVPINLRLTPEEIENCLAEAGATNIRRLERGSDFDRVEHIYQKNPFAEENFGVGENRFVFSK